MTATLNLSPNLKLPSAYVTGKAALLGRTGSGKTNTGVNLCEQMIENGYPLAIIDPQGDWWGLRSKFKIVIMGGEHGDIPLEPTAGELAADFMVDNRVPVLFDLFKMGEGEMVRFATDFARRLWTKNRDALHVFLDEADLFAPQRDLKGPKAACLGAWQNIVRRGRSRGIGCTMITQRSAVLNKDLLTQADPLIVHRLTAPQDLAAVDAYLEAHGIGREMAKGILSDLAAYKVGEACVISPGTLGIPPTRIKVGHRQSFDSSATPEVGKAAARPKDLASIDLDALSKQFAATIERAKADDPKELKKRIADLERELRAKPAPAVDAAAIERAIQERDRFWTCQLLEVKQGADDAIHRLDVAVTTLKTISARAQSLDLSAKNRKPITKQVNQTPAPAPETVNQTGKSAAAGYFIPNKTQQRILDALAWYESIGNTQPTNLQVGAIALIDTSGGHFSNTVGPLSTNGLVIRGDGSMRLTDAGRGLAQVPEQLVTLADYHAMLRDRVRKARSANGKTIDILDAVIDAGGREVTTEQIGEAVGIDPTGGHFSNTIGPLGTLGLIERNRGVVRPTEILFPKGVF